MSVPKENLDERIERIKRQTEEIEKKHREAEEDRLMALKMNALVTKSTLDDENWPKAHKYDELDFTYDVDPEKLEESNKAKEEEKLKPKRDYKKFAEGEGPPPDPKYNFLADNERDGTVNQQVFHKNDKFKQIANSNNSNKNKEQFSKRGGQNNSFRGGRGNNYSNNSKNSTQQQLSQYNQLQNHKLQSKSSQPEQWRNDKATSEDCKIGNNRSQNQKCANEKWKKDWDNDKMNLLHESHNRSPKHTAIKNTHNYQNQQTNVQQSNNSYSQVEYMIEKRGNITVSVSQTGEVKSVKLSSAPAIGTGRVGPRQLSKTNFQVQTKTSADNETFQTQFKQNVNIKSQNIENLELDNNNTGQKFCSSISAVENVPGSHSTNSELQKMQLQHLLQQEKQIKQQQQLFMQQQQLSQQLLTQKQQNTYGSTTPEVPKFCQSQLLKQSKQELLVRKQREQLHQQQQQLEHQQLLLQRQKDQQLQLSLLEQQKHQQIKSQQQQQDQLKQQILIQQLHQQQQKELMQQRQNLLKQQKHQQQQQQQQQKPQPQQLQASDQSQSSSASSFESHTQSNEIEKSNIKTLITKSPNKDKKNFKNNFAPKNELPSKVINSQMTVGILQMSEVNNSQNIGAAIIDQKVLDTVAKELSTKPEFAKKSVQDRLLRIRQNSNVDDIVSSNSEGTIIHNDLNSKMNLNIDRKSDLTESETVSCK